MRRIGQATTETEQFVEDGIGRLPNLGAKATAYEVVTSPAASPIRRAVDATGARVASAQGDEWFVKVYHPDALSLQDLEPVVDASTIAGELGVAPALVDADPEAGVLAFELLGEGWRWGRLDDLNTPQAMQAQMDLRRRIHAGPAFHRQRDVLEEIRYYAERARRSGVPLPPDMGWLLGGIEDVAPDLREVGERPVPAHGDGACSNVMVHDSGDLRLVDFDVAGNTDSVHDLAAMLVELCPFKEDVQEGVKAWVGHNDFALFSKCMLYGIADDLRWGLWGLVLFHESPRQDVEFFKYGQWRLLRARMNIQDRDFELWCRSCGKSAIRGQE